MRKMINGLISYKTENCPGEGIRDTWDVVEDNIKYADSEDEGLKRSKPGELNKFFIHNSGQLYD